MSALQDIKNLLPRISPAEKAELLQWVAQDMGEAFPGIESIPNVCGSDLLYFQKTKWLTD